MKRRSFIKYSGALTLASCQSKIINHDGHNKIGVALVGLGYYSSGLLAPALQLTQHCELRGIVTGSPEKIPEWQKKYRIKDANVYNYDNMHLLANNDDIDVIYIVVPTALHMKYAIAAAKCGKHVWLEKPMAMNKDQCQMIIDACKEYKVKLSIGYRMQHEPNTQTVIGYADSLPFGKITGVDSQAGYRGGGGSGWRYEKNMGGGALYDMGIYTINAIRYATGMIPTEVLSADQYQVRPEIMGDIDETSEYRLRFSNGLEAYGKTSVGEDMNHLKVQCETGSYELSPMQSYTGVKGSRSDGLLLDVYVENQQALQMDKDALSILNDTAVLVPGREGMIDVGIVEAIIKSAETGDSVVI